MQKYFSFKFSLTTILCISALGVYLIHEPARGGDTWGSWFFARVFVETGTFPILSRSPIYTVFASLFLPLGYPYGPAAARIFDGLFLFSGLFVLFRPYLGSALSVFSAAVWVPGLLGLEGIVLAHAVASLCWAFALRKGPTTRFKLSLSYAFLILVGMFRINYAHLVIAVAFYDIAKLLYRSGIKSVVSAVRPRIWDWPIALMVGAFVLFMTMQSDHRWNGPWRDDRTWLGSGQSSLSEAAQIGAFAQWIITNKYDGDFDNHDIYFIARDDFPKVKSIFEYYKHPDVIQAHLYSNKQIISFLARITDIGEALFQGMTQIANHKFSYPVFYALLLLGLIGFFRRLTNQEEKTHIWELLASIVILSAPLIIAYPTSRYYFHFIPLFIIAGAGFGQILFDRTEIFERITPRFGRYGRQALLVLPVVLFSNGVSRTATVLGDIGQTSAWQRPNLVKEVYEGRFHEVAGLLNNCRGIMMTSNYTLMAAFSPLPIDKFYSIFEIPPFGRYNAVDYTGLRPDRIDCIIIKKESIKRGMKTYTTKWSRYENYLVPYIEILKSIGAKNYQFDVDGGIEVTILR